MVNWSVKGKVGAEKAAGGRSRVAVKMENMVDAALDMAEQLVEIKTEIKSEIKSEMISSKTVRIKKEKGVVDDAEALAVESVEVKPIKKEKLHSM